MQATTQNQDTAESWITRCPECNTAFRITRKHLLAAQGAVRCGSCLHVFKAHQYIVGSELPADLQPSPALSRSTSFAEQQPIPEQSFSVSSQDDHNDTKISNHPDEGVTPDNELEFREDVFSISDDDQEAESPDEEAWARAMLKEMDLEDDIDEPLAESRNTEQPQKKPLEQKTEPKQEESNHSESQTPPLQEEKTAEARDFAALPEDPLDLYYRGESRWHRLVLPFASLLAVALLAGQYAWTHFNDIAHIPSFRPAAATLCRLLPCQLPEPKDLSQVRVRNIVVRNDPEYQHALTVDAIITNEASYSQPYPELLMIVSGQNQNILGTAS